MKKALLLRGFFMGICDMVMGYELWVMGYGFVE